MLILADNDVTGAVAADPQRVLRDTAYTEAVALRLLDCLDRMDSLRGTMRLFVL
jgi:hypothetical protein